MKTFTVLSLWAGVQSSTLLLLACQGQLEKPDAAIFADTGWEPQGVYEHLWWLAEQAYTAGISLVVASKGNLREDALRARVRGTLAEGSRAAPMPLFTRSPEGKIGMIRRQCTKEYKLEVVHRAIRDMLGIEKGHRMPPDIMVRQWIGISIDEKQRMRLSPHRWMTNEYPLIGWPSASSLGSTWTRAHCLEWFHERYPLRSLPRSACIGCPFHSDAEWREMKEERPSEFADACSFDRTIRDHGGLRGATFLHRSCLPLTEIDFSRAEEGQLSFGNECLGMCGV